MFLFPKPPSPTHPQACADMTGDPPPLSIWSDPPPPRIKCNLAPLQLTGRASYLIILPPYIPSRQQDVLTFLCCLALACITPAWILMTTKRGSLLMLDTLTLIIHGCFSPASLSGEEFCVSLTILFRIKSFSLSLLRSLCHLDGDLFLVISRPGIFPHPPCFTHFCSSVISGLMWSQQCWG